MKAIIFSAGLGTRLRPLTNHCPKALVQLNGRPLLWYAIQKMINSGVSQIVVNVHHFSEQIIEYIHKNQFAVPVLISDESNLLLDTGGGLFNARQLLQGTGPIIACNVDIISSINLSGVVEEHLNSQALATLVVRERQTSRYFMFNNAMQLAGWKNQTTGENKISRSDFSHSIPLAFSGIHVLSPEIFEYITERGKFSIVELYLRLASDHIIKGFIDHSEFWLDVGKPEQLKIAERYFNTLR